MARKPWHYRPLPTLPRRTSRRADDLAVRDATDALDAAMARWPEVQETVEDMRAIRERNHLAENIRRALGGEPT